MASLSEGRGRSDEPGRLDPRKPPLRRRPGLPCLGRRTLGRLPAASGNRRAAGAETAAGTLWLDAGRGSGRGDPTGAGRQPLSRRGLPQGQGAPSPSRPAHLQGAGAPPDTRERPLGGDAGGPSPRTAHPRRTIPEAIDMMWGTDMTAAFTTQHGRWRCSWPSTIARRSAQASTSRGAARATKHLSRRQPMAA